jgi:chromosomal replication initiator protein
MTTIIERERWSRVKALLHAELGDDVFSSWFVRMELESVGEHAAFFSVPTRFLKSWLQSHYMDRVLAYWQAEDHQIHKVEMSVRSAMVRTLPPEVQSSNPIARPLNGDVVARNGDSARIAPGLLSGRHDALGGSPLDLRLTFETFVVGRSNTLVHAAGKQVAEALRGDPVMFNPLYIHAGVGLGKTHMLQAITWAGNAGVERRVLYLTAEKFMYSFVSALRSQTALAFKASLRGIDALVIDDLQFLQGKTIQAEFCHTINSLIDAGRQIVIASDRPPADLENLDDRMRSRLAGGLVVTMGTLGQDMRLEILKLRVLAARQHHASFDVPEAVLGYIAVSVTQSGRDLEGAINRLLANNKLTGQPVTMEMAEREVRDLIRPREPKRVMIEDIQRVVSLQYNVSRADIQSQRRTANIVRPRQMAMYLAKTLTLRSLPEIGRKFGGRDHTTVLHAVRKIEGLVGSDTMLADQVETLKRQLQE